MIACTASLTRTGLCLQTSKAHITICIRKEQQQADPKEIGFDRKRQQQSHAYHKCKQRNVHGCDLLNVDEELEYIGIESDLR